MDKHNNQQKNKNKNAKKPLSRQAVLPVSQEQPAVKDEAATLQGKKTNSSTSKTK
jgi:hypothetical protein